MSPNKMVSDHGFRQNPQSLNTGVRTKISSLPIHARFAKISGTNSTNSQHKGHKIYTGSGHRCGVISYSSVVVVDCLLG